MGYAQTVSGWTRLSASGQIGDTGKPLAIAGYTVVSGATAAVPYMLNGSTGSGALAWRLPGTASVAVLSVNNYPVILSLGCYVSFDANTTEVTVYWYQQATS